MWEVYKQEANTLLAVDQNCCIDNFNGKVMAVVTSLKKKNSYS